MFLSGGSSNTFLKKVTIGLAIGFMITSLFLTILSMNKRSHTVTESVPVQPAPATAPAQQPAATPGTQPKPVSAPAK